MELKNSGSEGSKRKNKKEKPSPFNLTNPESVQW